MRVLKKGLKDYAEIHAVQQLLKDLNFYHGRVDGDFGKGTDNAVKLYQREKGLKADGIVGNNTYAKLKIDGLKIKAQKESLDFLEDEEIRKIVDANSHFLIAEPNRNNPEPTPFDPEKHLVVVAIRGYQLDSVGARGKNDRRVYDDAHFIVTPRGILRFKGNTDPNGYRKGYGYGSQKGMAMLDTGVWFFGKGPHKGSPAFRQACPFTVVRDGSPSYKHTGYHAINWHSGGYSTTSSLGCQTNKPNEFQLIRNYIYEELENLDNPTMFLDYKYHGLRRSFPYILINEKDRRAGRLKVK